MFILIFYFTWNCKTITTFTFKVRRLLSVNRCQFRSRSMFGLCALPQLSRRCSYELFLCHIRFYQMQSKNWKNSVDLVMAVRYFKSFSTTVLQLSHPCSIKTLVWLSDNCLNNITLHDCWITNGWLSNNVLQLPNYYHFV